MQLMGNSFGCFPFFIQEIFFYIELDLIEDCKYIVKKKAIFTVTPKTEQPVNV